ncbi:hypothetical protein MVR12_005284 [Escherichia coli]|uniref:Uncharacterized protein n=1 Tax=Obesumbacterium proteus ATCC 12841 TaxID=1354268 RepID=A0AA91EFT3_9GAMM|nr:MULTISPECIES: hypothetical protein [Hafniaceae]EAQ6918641.1 hypothetical protein [Salmonella enterica]EJA4670278.1 hypothetical protein [Escherichia coli]AMO83172.1 hypothetical protein DSM2777_20255 [Obesumbacterium proteus]MCE9949405.1 hypothetical protein [Hafnia paralvei]OAT59758.1 hypothetical protein M993_01489 [Obesumbacterium proteus ATCC 12841]
MTKLTTERLEEIAKLEITEFSNGMDIAKDAYQSVGSSEIVLMARQLLAYEQAAEHPAARITWDGSEFSVSNVSEDFLYGGTAVYLAPVLPKQPEHSRQHFESLCNQFWNWAELDEIDQDEEPRLEWNGSNYTHRVTAALWKMYQAAPAQPVIPEQPDAQDLELYIDMLENSDSDDQDGELNNTQLIMWLKELQRRRTLPAQPANGDKQ